MPRSPSTSRGDRRVIFRQDPIRERDGWSRAWIVPPGGTPQCTAFRGNAADCEQIPRFAVCDTHAFARLWVRLHVGVSDKGDHMKKVLMLTLAVMAICAAGYVGTVMA